VKRSGIAVRRLVPLVLVALAAGTIAAQADGTPKRPHAPRAAAAAAAVVRVQAVMAASGTTPRAWYFGGCPPSTKPANGAPPSQDLLNAFAILRRERTPDDALPAEALKALERAGLAPVAAESARLLRSTASGGKAWVVPVPDVGRAGRFPCFGRPAPLKRGKFVEPTTPKPREGLAVVALGDAAQGGGGALTDLVRGRAAATINPCAGPDRNMLGVSGVVPNGVPAVFLTAPDGTAVKADVKDNGYEFLLPRPKTAGQRYVVWTGGDGTPHVQPIAALGGWFGQLTCSKAVASRLAKVPRISPSPGFAPCALERPVKLTPHPKASNRRRAVPVPLFVDCQPAALAVPFATAPPPAVVFPKAVPKKHR
jgi:hypothetical protein